MANINTTKKKVALGNDIQDYKKTAQDMEIKTFVILNTDFIN